MLPSAVAGSTIAMLLVLLLIALLTAFIGAPWFLWQFSRTVSRQVT